MCEKRVLSRRDLQTQRQNLAADTKAEIRMTGTSRQFGFALATYDKLLGKARDGYLGPMNLARLKEIKRDFARTFTTQGAADVYYDWVKAAALRNKANSHSR